MAIQSIPAENDKKGSDPLHQIVLTHEQWSRIGEAYFHHGLLKHDRRSFKAAVSAFRRADGMPPADRFCWLARAYGDLALHSIFPFQVGYALLSRIYLRKALRHHPHHAFSYYVLGLWHQRMPKWAGGRSEKVLACLERAIALQADQTLFRIERMRWLLKNNLREEALQECRRIISAPSGGFDDDRRKIEAERTLEQYRAVEGRSAGPERKGQNFLDKIKKARYFMTLGH